ncbi:MAG: glycosyltransferase [Aigarchaeota archaeon]|nr:glycosyltransferase [Candidatus Pelearchaeum maunauluense]
MTVVKEIVSARDLYGEELVAPCTSFDYEDYEVIVVDDSNDETTRKLEAWRDHPKVKIIHRSCRESWKGTT